MKTFGWYLCYIRSKLIPNPCLCRFLVLFLFKANHLKCQLQWSPRQGFNEKPIRYSWPATYSTWISISKASEMMSVILILLYPSPVNDSGHILLWICTSCTSYEFWCKCVLLEGIPEDLCALSVYHRPTLASINASSGYYAHRHRSSMYACIFWLGSFCLLASLYFRDKIVMISWESRLRMKINSRLVNISDVFIWTQGR